MSTTVCLSLHMRQQAACCTKLTHVPMMQLLGVLAEARPYQQALVLSEEARIVSGNGTNTPAPAAATAG